MSSTLEPKNHLKTNPFNGSTFFKVVHSKDPNRFTKLKAEVTKQKQNG